jgi:hypothetical protein
MGIRTLALGLALFALGAGTARGACGDWLADHSTEEGNQRADRDYTDRDLLPELPCPCEGPECGSSPLQQPAAPPATNTIGEKSGLASTAGMKNEWSRAPRFAHPQNDDRLAEISVSPLRRPPRA